MGMGKTLKANIHLSSKSPSNVCAIRDSPGTPAAPTSASNRNLANGGTPKGLNGLLRSVTLHFLVFKLNLYSRRCKHEVQMQTVTYANASKGQ